MKYNPDNYYYGRVCEKHPELKGLRKKSRRTCPKCASASCMRSYFKRKERERLTPKEKACGTSTS